MSNFRISSTKFFLIVTVLLLLGVNFATAQISVTSPTLTKQQGSAPEWVNITVGNLTSQNVTAFQFTLSYNKNVIFIDSASAGSIAAGGLFIFNADTVNQKITVAFASAYPLSGSGTLVQFKIHYLNNIGTSPLTFNGTFEFNAGTPSASVTEGNITIINSIKPAVITNAASNITQSAATLNGLVITKDSSAAVQFEYGTTTGYGATITASQSPVTSNSSVNVSSNITGLTPNTLYHYRVKATNSGGAISGLDKTFTTLIIQLPPVALTLAATNIGSTSSTLNGLVNANGLSTTVQFEYGTTTSYGASVTSAESPVTGTSNANVSVNITGLTAFTLYHFRVKATNTSGTNYGEDFIFTTYSIPFFPSASTLSATNLGANSASLNGTANANDLSTSVQFEYGTTTSYGSTITAVQSPLTGHSTAHVSADLTGLTPNTLYHYRVKAANTAGTAYGQDSTFTTLSSGITWQATSGPYPYKEILSLATNVNNVFAGTNGNGVYLTTDNGASWTQLYNGLSNGIVRALAVNSSGGVFAGTDGGVNISTNNGTSWKQVVAGFGTDTLIQALAINSLGYIFAGTSEGGVFLSTNNGTNWTQVSNGLSILNVHSVAVNPSGYVFAGTVGVGVFLSTNNGLNWSQANTGITNTTIWSLATNSSGYVFAGTFGGGVFRSTNNGSSWTAQNDGLPINPDVYSLTINSTGTVFAGLGYLNLGVYSSGDNGSTWSQSGLPDNNVSALAVSSTGYVYAGTYEAGVYRTSSPTAVAAIPLPPILISPANGATGISKGGTLSWNKSVGATIYRVQFSTDSTFGTIINDTNIETISENGGFNTSTKYYWRVNASNTSGTSNWSTVWNFTTVANPLALTMSATNITQTSATLNGVINTYGINTAIQFEFGTTTSYGSTVTASQSPVTSSSNVSVSASIGDLVSNTLYHFRIKASNSNGTNYSADSTFTTLNSGVLLSPTVSTKSATNVSTTISTLNCLVNANGSSTTVQFEYGTTASYGSTATAYQVTGSSEVSDSAIIGNLTPYTLYHYRAKATNSSGTTYGSDMTFMTGFSYPASISLSKSYTFNDPTKTSSFKLIALPGNLSTSLTQFITGTAKQDWDAYYDNGDTSNYLKEFDNTSAFQFKPGSGYWVISKNAINISQSVNMVALNSDNSYSVALHSGWNIISNPFDKSVVWDSVISANSLSSNTALYGWNASWTTSGSFDPYQGYYFYNLQNFSSLKIPYNPNGTIGKVVSKVSAFTRYNETNSLKLSLESGGGVKSVAYISIDSTAKNDYDAHDILVPPGDFVDAGIALRNEKLSIGYKNLMKESRPMNGNGQTFDLIITNNQKDKITLKIDGVHSLIGNEVYLLDLYNHKLYNLKENNVIDLTLVIKSSYQLLIGNREYINAAEKEILPKQFALYQNYPNPFNPGTTIEYSIPKTSNVSLKVYDILGKEVATLVNGQKTAGYYRINFTTSGNTVRLSSGVYFYRMQAGSFVETKKLLLLK